MLTFVDARGSLSEREVAACERVPDGCRPMGRRPEGLSAPTLAPDRGGYFARAAFLEGASVPAFERMAAELRSFGAPGALIERAEAACADERRHCAAMTALARRFGANAEPVRVGPFEPRSLEDFAVENAVEGCVFETFAAAVAMHQARHAEDAAVRRAMAVIAAEELAHAALAHDAHAWALAALDDARRGRVARAAADALDRLYDSIAREGDLDAVRAWAGEPPARRRARPAGLRVVSRSREGRAGAPAPRARRAPSARRKRDQLSEHAPRVALGGRGASVHRAPRRLERAPAARDARLDARVARCAHARPRAARALRPVDALRPARGVAPGARRVDRGAAHERGAGFRPSPPLSSGSGRLPRDLLRSFVTRASTGTCRIARRASARCAQAITGEAEDAAEERLRVSAMMRR